MVTNRIGSFLKRLYIVLGEVGLLLGGEGEDDGVGLDALNVGDLGLRVDLADICTFDRKLLRCDGAELF